MSGGIIFSIISMGEGLKGMILGFLGLLLRDPASFFKILPLILITFVGALLVAITVHEFGHAYVAHLLGDDTARRLGRLSLNPLVHLDVMGTALLLLVGIGWGKPVPVNASNLRVGSRKGMALVAAAGPGMNLLTVALLGVFVRVGIVSDLVPRLSYAPEALLASVFSYIILYNIILALFNLIPLVPLDGFNVALGILPRALSYSYAKLERYGPALLLVLLVVDNFLRLGIIWRLLGPAARFIGGLLVGQPLPL